MKKPDNGVFRFNQTPVGGLKGPKKVSVVLDGKPKVASLHTANSTKGKTEKGIVKKSKPHAQHGGKEWLFLKLMGGSKKIDFF